MIKLPKKNDLSKTQLPIPFWRRGQYSIFLTASITAASKNRTNGKRRKTALPKTPGPLWRRVWRTCAGPSRTTFGEGLWRGVNGEKLGIEFDAFSFPARQQVAKLEGGAQERIKSPLEETPIASRVGQGDGEAIWKARLFPLSANLP